jgi:hypothetical protein
MRNGLPVTPLEEFPLASVAVTLIRALLAFGKLEGMLQA